MLMLYLAANSFKNLEILGRSQQSFGKRERELKREKKRKEKEAKKLARLENKNSLDDDSMIAYVDQYGNVTDTSWHGFLS